MIQIEPLSKNRVTRLTCLIHCKLNKKVDINEIQEKVIILINENKTDKEIFNFFGV